MASATCSVRLRGLAGSIGLAPSSFPIVVLLGMHRLVYIALTGMIGLASAFAGLAVFYQACRRSGCSFRFWCRCSSPRHAVRQSQRTGHAADGTHRRVGAAVIGTVVTALSAIIGSLIGQAYDGTILPLSLGFAGFGVLALAFCLWADR
jgi:DHA1 family bicyclomycin/chloramphenicol resistance-like MFS transporter